ncbi:MAG: NosD domain-containing protein [Chthoniobacterales bacterium]
MVFKKRGAAYLVLACLISGQSFGQTTLQERIDSTAPGATIQVDAGEYKGSIVIDKSLTLVGSELPVIDGEGEGSVISILADDVTVRGFRIINSGTKLSKDNAGIHITGARATIASNHIEDVLHGVYIKKAEGFRVINNRIVGKTTLPQNKLPDSESVAADGPDLCSPLNINSRGNGIHMWNSSGGLIDGNRVTETRDGIYFSFTRNTEVRANHIHRVRYGLHYMYSDSNIFEGNTFEGNAAGAAIMYSKNLIVTGNRFVFNEGYRAYGLLLNSVDNTRIEGNFLTHNTVGIYIENNNRNTIIGNEIKDNYIGVRMTASSNDNSFTQNHFAGNMHAAEMAGQNESNTWSVDGIGNYWQNADTVDIDADGIGDLPHREADLIGDLRRDAPITGLLSGSPGLSLLEFIHRHAKLPGIDAIEDPYPLTPYFKKQ